MKRKFVLRTALAALLILLAVGFSIPAAAEDAPSLMLTENQTFTDWGEATEIEFSNFAVPPSHTCVFDRLVVSADYLKEGDGYYKSCECGAASSKDTFRGGTCGDSLVWKLDLTTGALAIEGEGEMYDYVISSSMPYGTDAPWATYADSIRSLAVGDGVTHLGYAAFYGCENMVTADLGNTLWFIGAYAFYDCEKLVEVYIPKSLATCSMGAFSGCMGMERVYITDIVAWCDIYFENSVANPMSYQCDLYLNGAPVTSLVLPDSVITIGSNVFYGCQSLRSIVIPDGIVQIGSGAFMHCSNLTSVTLPDSICSIENFAFNCCSSLATIDLPEELVTIGDFAFAHCEKLTNVVLPKHVTHIRSCAFMDCGALTSFVFPQGTVEIGYGVLDQCQKLEWVTVLSTYTTVHQEESTFPSTAIIRGFAGSAAEVYANRYGRTFVSLANDAETVFELSVTYKPYAINAGQYFSVISLTRVDANTSSALAFLFVEGATGELYVKSTDGNYLALYDEEGSALALGSEATDIAVIYDDNSGIARYYVDGAVPYVGDEKALANYLPVHDPTFHSMVAVKDEFDILAGVVVTDAYNINASGTADYVGFQVNTNDSSSIRLLAGLDMLYYSSTGFDVELYSNGILQGAVPATAKTVYAGVTVNGETVTADSLGYRYLTALTISGIDRTQYPSDAEVYFIVKTYTMVGGVKQYGAEKKIVITHDASTGEHVYNLDDTYIAP